MTIDASSIYSISFVLFAVVMYIDIIVFLFFRVVDVVQKEKSKARPIALNTVELLRAASSGLGNCVCLFVVIFCRDRFFLFLI